ncbi:MAG: hypothetical protein QXW97_03790 [Candidatus Pacearchaeota archaeon]
MKLYIKKEKSFMLLSILFIFLITTNIYAANDTTESEKSYDCLKKQLGNNCGNTQNTIQNAFNLIAMAYDSGVQNNCKSALNNKKKTNCWGDTANSASCSIKATAISTLALKYINSNVDESINWLKSKRKLTNDLVWYLEIDSNNATQCNINGQSFIIKDDKKISGNDPSGLKKAYGNYWFEIVDLRKNYTITCNSSFITSLIFKKPNSPVYFVSSMTRSASAGDSITEYVNSYCFTTTDNCDYEGTLWATLVFSRASEDISPYMPYIVALSEDSSNNKYIPLAFLYMFDNSVDDYLQKLLSLQKQNKYWKESDNLLYDTGIALLALQGLDITQVSSTKDYLLTLRETSGDLAGCWKSNTALLLYAGWPKAPSIGGGGPGPSNRDCTTYNYFCVSRGECPVNSTLDNFYCTGLTDICCSVRPAEQTCEQKGGIICSKDEECSQTVIPALGTTSCCLGSCQKITPPENECENNNGFCKKECGKNQEEKPIYQSSCAFNEKCCVNKPVKPVNWWLIILLIILIILVILAIIFRNQLKIWWFKIKTQIKFKKGPEPTKRPSPPLPPPTYLGRRPTNIIPRQVIPRPVQPQRSVPKPPLSKIENSEKKSDKDKDFEETMKKLREMSK